MYRREVQVGVPRTIHRKEMTMVLIIYAWCGESFSSLSKFERIMRYL